MKTSVKTLKVFVVSAICLFTFASFSLNNDPRVSVCHNGQRIVVSIKAVPAHLAHRDKLVRCNGEHLPDE